MVLFRYFTCGAGIDNPGLGQLVLQLEHCLACLGGLARARGAQVLRLVTLVEHDAAVKVVAAPVQDLL